jgi:two-component system cell cycle sensor histidine kinase PleC
MAWTMSASPWLHGWTSEAVTRADAGLHRLRSLCPKTGTRPWLRILAVGQLAGLLLLERSASLSLLLLVSSGIVALAFFAPATSATAGEQPPASQSASTAQHHPHAPARDVSVLDGTSKAELMAQISHELRTPLNAILGFSGLMEQQVFGPVGHPRYEEYLAHIRTSSRDLMRSAEHALAVTDLLSRNDAEGCRQPQRLSHALRDAWSTIGAQAAVRGIRLAVSGTEDIDVLCDRRGFRQALVSLLAEALRRADNGSAITVSANCAAGAIHVLVAVHCRPGGLQAIPGALSVRLAHALLELQGATLTEGIAADRWTASVAIERAVQGDFFAA